jgi:hypothetical protein
VLVATREVKGHTAARKGFIAQRRPSSSQRGEPDRLCPRQFKGAGPRPTPNGGQGLVYDLDVVPKVATERRWEVVMRASVWVYGSDVWCVGGCKRVGSGEGEDGRGEDGGKGEGRRDGGGGGGKGAE